MSVFREFQPRDVSREGAANADTRNALGTLVATQGEFVFRPEDAITETKIKENHLLLLSGDHGGARITKPGTILQGVPGSRITRLVTTENAPILFRNLWFASINGSNNLDRLINITGTSGNIVFHGCRFTKAGQHAPEHVRLASGVRVTFIGCLFEGAALNVGDVINVLSANPLDCQIIGCVNLTGNAYGTVTNTGSF